MIVPTINLSELARPGDHFQQAIDRLPCSAAVIVDVVLPFTHHPITLNPMCQALVPPGALSPHDSVMGRPA